MSATATEIAEKLCKDARSGCYCGQNRKPCQYHEGYEDGMDMLIAELERGAVRGS